jgi:hypothetical protein
VPEILCFLLAFIGLFAVIVVIIEQCAQYWPLIYEGKEEELFATKARRHKKMDPKNKNEKLCATKARRHKK